MRSKLARVLGVVGLLILLLGVAAVIKIGPRFIIGILRYDTRREGELRIGDRAPDIKLLALDGAQAVKLSDWVGQRPLILVFGSFT